MKTTSSIRRRAAAALIALAAAMPALAQTASGARDADGLVRVRSSYPVDETVRRLKDDIAAKGILYFHTVDQAQLAAQAGISLRPSMLLEFGNPPLGAQFLTANQSAGLDWPVRLLVTQDADGSVWATWTDFAWIARRHGITTRDAQFAMAQHVVESITSTIR